MITEKHELFLSFLFHMFMITGMKTYCVAEQEPPLNVHLHGPGSRQQQHVCI